MKKQDGVSLIILAITIIVMIILATIAVISGTSSVKETVEVKIETEIAELKKAVADRMIEYERNPSNYPLVGTRIDNVAEYLYHIDGMSSVEIANIVAKVNDENISYYRLVDSESAKSLGVQSVGKEHYFIVDYYHGQVYGIVDISAMDLGSE